MTSRSLDPMNTPNFPENAPRNASMTMPNVFVVPPEEDKTPPWCFFDAENPRLSQIQEKSEIDMSSISADPDELIFERDTIQPGPGGGFETRSIVDALLADGEYANDSASESSFEGHMEIEDDDQSFQEGASSSGPRSNQDREPGDDSDVIEVVKVSRRKSLAEDQGENQSLRAFSEYKKSMTLKSRASKVFRSLRGTLRSSKPRAEDVFSAPPPPPLPSLTRRMSQATRKSDYSERDPVPRPRTPTISRKKSNVITQLFTAPSLKSRSSMSSFDDHAAPPPVEANPIPSPPVSPQSSHFGSQPLSRRASLYTPSQEDETRLRAASPTPTTSSSKSRNRRFSIMNLHKLFSFSSSSSAQPQTAVSSDDESGRATPTLRSDHSTPSAASSISTVSSPKTPTTNEVAPPVRLVTKEEPAGPQIVDDFDSIFDNNLGLNLGLGLTLDSGSSVNTQQATPRKERTSISWSSITPTALKRSDTKKSSSRSTEIDDPGDTSLEMRLDSFHFDDLSFDANRF